jgi:N-acetylglucosamine-6-phosphate deacetylase
MKIFARWWLEEKPRCWEIVDHSLVRSEPTDEPSSLILAPTLHDIQVNGGGGVSFTSDSLNVEDVARVVQLHRRHGTASFFPTVITASRATMLHSLRTIREAIEADPNIAEACPGLHLEGPAISPEDGYRGAHPKEQVRAFDWNEFCELQEASVGRIRLVTLAPEVDGTMDNIRNLVHSGVRVALGHTAAIQAQVREAILHGATLCTHFGNGLPKLMDRHQNPLWSMLAEEGLHLSLIADGHHLPHDLFRVACRVKQKRIVLISDASSYAGALPGRYTDWGSEIDVLENGRVQLANTPYLAGSGMFLQDCVSWASKHGMKFHEAIRAATTTPRELFGLPQATTWLLWDESRRMTDILDAARVVESVP